MTAPITPFQERIFGEPADVLRASNTLLRLVKLDNALPRRDRPMILQQLSELWSKSQPSFAETKAALQEGLNVFKRPIKALHADELASIQTAEELNAFMLRCKRDAKSIPSSPAFASNLGLNGPTLLVSYLRPDETFRTTYHKKYVLKWTTWNEVCCHRIYSAFSHGFMDPDRIHTFAVPAAATIDLEYRIHEAVDGSHTLLPSVDPLHETFSEIVRGVCPSRSKDHQQIMFIKRIRGENLFDFAKTKYQHLSSEQKANLFTRLGRIAMLDLLMGNLDRCNQVQYSAREQAYFLSDIESNLGNLMLQWSGSADESPLLYAIDNGIHPDLIEDVSKKEQYHRFLADHLRQPNMPELSAEQLSRSIINGISSLCEVDEEYYNVNDHKALFKDFIQDLESFGKKKIALGIAQMYEMLDETHLPKWDGEEGHPLKAHLEWTYPKLRASLSERFEIFKSRGV